MASREATQRFQSGRSASGYYLSASASTGKHRCKELTFFKPQFLFANAFSLLHLVVHDVRRVSAQKQPHINSLAMTAVLLQSPTYARTGVGCAHLANALHA